MQLNSFFCLYFLLLFCYQLSTHSEVPLLATVFKLLSVSWSFFPSLGHKYLLWGRDAQAPLAASPSYSHQYNRQCPSEDTPKFVLKFLQSIVQFILIHICRLLAFELFLPNTPLRGCFGLVVCLVSAWGSLAGRPELGLPLHAGVGIPLWPHFQICLESKGLDCDVRLHGIMLAPQALLLSRIEGHTFFWVTWAFDGLYV